MPLSDFLQIFENLKSGCLRGSSLSEASEGEFRLQKLKNCNFQTQLGAYLLPTFYWKSLFIFNKILAIFMSIDTFLVLMPLLGILNFWPLKKGGVWEGTSPQKLKKCIFKTQFAKFGAYLLPTFYWKSIIFFQWNIGYYYVYSSRLFETIIY